MRLCVVDMDGVFGFGYRVASYAEWMCRMASGAPSCLSFSHCQHSDAHPVLCAGEWGGVPQALLSPVPLLHSAELLPDAARLGIVFSEWWCACRCREGCPPTLGRFECPLPTMQSGCIAQLHGAQVVICHDDEAVTGHLGLAGKLKRRGYWVNTMQCCWRAHWMPN